ncbi:hypothetical protein ACR9MS_00695 [Helicobacter pylori]
MDIFLNKGNEFVFRADIRSVPITQDEALYILEKLLDKDNQEIILKSQDSRSISSRLPIEIPLFVK